MSFDLRAETHIFQNKEYLTLLMRVNSNRDSDWFNCCAILDHFNNKQEAWLTLKPMIINLLNACYNEPEVVLR